MDEHYLQHAVNDYKTCTQLKLQNQQIEQVHAQLGKVCKQVHRIEFAHNSIQDVTFLDSFSNQLTNINLSNNRIGNISSLSKCTSLVVCNLGHNPITSFPFSLPTLKALILNDANLDSFPTAALPNLETLNLRTNRITAIPKDVHTKFPKLSILNLSNNSISDVPTSLTLLPELKTLSLHGNKISQLPMEMKQCQSLQQLDLKKNAIKDWEVVQICGTIPKLWKILLFGNPIQVNNPAEFYTAKVIQLCPKLKNLDDKPIHNPNLKRRTEEEKKNFEESKRVNKKQRKEEEEEFPDDLFVEKNTKLKVDDKTEAVITSLPASNSTVQQKQPKRFNLDDLDTNKEDSVEKEEQEDDNDDETDEKQDVYVNVKKENELKKKLDGYAESSSKFSGVKKVKRIAPMKQSKKLKIGAEALESLLAHHTEEDQIGSG